MAPLIDNAPFTYMVDQPSARRRATATWPLFLVVIFATFLLGPYPLSLAAGGARVQIWRVVFVLGALMVVPAVLRSAQGRPRVPTMFLLMSAFWLGWGLLSFGWAPSLASGTIELFGLVTGVSLAATVGLVGGQSAAHQRLLTRCWTVAVGAESALALVEYVTGVHLPSPHGAGLGALGIHTRFLTGTFANPNDVAAFLLLGLPLCVASVGTWPRRWQRRASVAAIVMASIVIVISKSRLCTLGLLVGAIAYMTLTKSGGRRPYRGRLSYLWLLVLPVALLAAKPSILAKFGNLANEWSRGGSLRDRVLLIRHGWDAAYRTRFLGLGIGGFEPSVRALPTQLASSGDVNPHNFAMELLSQYGLLVFASFWSWFMMTFRAIQQERRRALAVDRRSFAAALTTAAMVSFAVFIPASSDPSSFIEQGTGWLFLGSLLAIAPLSADRRL